VVYVTNSRVQDGKDAMHIGTDYTGLLIIDSNDGRSLSTGYLYDLTWSPNYKDFMYQKEKCRWNEEYTKL
jgi:hypothetical protein